MATQATPPDPASAEQPRITLQVRLHPDEPERPQALPEDAVDGRCCAYESELGQVERDGVTYHARTYTFYYPDNLALGCWGARVNPHSTAWGYHPDDVEAVTVLFSRDTGLPCHVFFFAHADRQGMWVAWQDCLRTIGGALVVYSARGSHASYPRAGTYWRVFGLANDVCSSRGHWVDLDTPALLPAREVQLAGGLGMDSTLRVPPVKSITPWQRWALPLYRALQ